LEEACTTPGYKTGETSIRNKEVFSSGKIGQANALVNYTADLVSAAGRG
jgi:hypothetical protein